MDEGCAHPNHHSFTIRKRLQRLKSPKEIGNIMNNKLQIAGDFGEWGKDSWLHDHHSFSCMRGRTS
jgi:hypothetical protein